MLRPVSVVAVVLLMCGCFAGVMRVRSFGFANMATIGPSTDPDMDLVGHIMTAQLKNSAFECSMEEVRRGYVPLVVLVEFRISGTGDETIVSNVSVISANGQASGDFMLCIYAHYSALTFPPTSDGKMTLTISAGFRLQAVDSPTEKRYIPQAI